MPGPATAVSQPAGQSSNWWQGCREDTPACQRVVHLNNAGASLQPAAVVEAVQGYIQEEADIGGYEAVTKHADALARPYTALAQLLNCSPDEIAIVSSATSAWGQIFFGVPFKHGDVVLTSQAEYGSNYLAYLQARKRFGIEVQVIPETPDGDIDVQQLQVMLHQQPRPVLVSITHVPTSSGRVYDASAVGAAAAAVGVPFLLDACQSAGQMPLDVQALRCDFLTGTSRKYLRGPRGIGFLYRRTTSLITTAPASNSGNSGSSGSSGSSHCSSKASMVGWEPAMLDIHGAEWLRPDAYRVRDGAVAYEQYEVNFAAKVGFGVALDYALTQGIKRCWLRTQQLAERLRSQLLQHVPGLEVQDRGRQLCGIVSFTLKSYPQASAVQAALAARQPRINVHVSGIGSTRLDFEARGLVEVVRASVAYYNSEEELDALVAALQELVAAAAHLQLQQAGAHAPGGGA